MIKSGLNANEIAALRRLAGEPIVQSQDFQSNIQSQDYRPNLQSQDFQSTNILSSSNFGEVHSSMPIPDTPTNGVLVKVDYAGACFKEGRSSSKRYTPQFPGNEIAGTIHDMGNNTQNSNLSIGDRVIVVPETDNHNTGYAEYIPMADSRVIQVPDEVPLEVAAMLPGSALSAYAAILAAKPHVEKLQKIKSKVNVLVVGGGALSLWSIKLSQYLLGKDCNNVKVMVADNSIERLMEAQDHGCSDIIYWNEEDHEEYIVERTMDSCRGGVDVVIDFVGSHRTMQRSLKVLNREGLILVGGNSTTETCIPLNSLAAKQQSIMGIPKGNLNQLLEILNAVANKTLQVPEYKVFPIEDSKQTFESICECRVTARAIFKFGSQISSHTVDNQ